jgi:Leucine-rich repeat (LRR) protein
MRQLPLLQELALDSYTIPSALEIGQLQQLKTLELQLSPSSSATMLPNGHNINWSDLRSIGTLTSLETIKLCLLHFEFSELPNEIASIPKLQSLTLLGCNQLERLPSNLDTALVHLRVSQCQSFQTLPPEIGMLINLETLQIAACDQLTSIPDEIFGALLKLQTLKITECHKLQSIPSSIGALKNLTTLELSLLSMLEGIPSEIGRLTQLQYLDISECNFPRIFHHRFWNCQM